MAKDIWMRLNSRSIEHAIKAVEGSQRDLKNKAQEFARRLGEVGLEVAKTTMSGHIHSGETMGSLELVDNGNGRMTLTAGSKALLFFEFGAGITYGSGHPQAGELGMGPGTYPGKGHWNNPNGWWYPTDDARLIRHTDKHGQGWAHTYGNKPHMPMYKAAQAMRKEIEGIAREVFGN